jgi:hypothetical protein
MLYLYHRFHFSFLSQIIWLCFAGQWCALDSASTCNLELLSAKGAVLLLLDQRIVLCGRLGCLGLDYPLISKFEPPWWRWLLASATPPSGELLELPSFEIHLTVFESWLFVWHPVRNMVKDLLMTLCESCIYRGKYYIFVCVCAPFHV